MSGRRRASAVERERRYAPGMLARGRDALPFFLAAATFLALGLSPFLRGCKDGATGHREAPEVVVAPSPTATMLGRGVAPSTNAPVGKRAASSLEELRGVWITNVDSEVLFSGAGIEGAFARLDEHNFTTAYPVVYNRGYTLYPSEVMRANGGVAQYPKPELAGRDLPRELLEAGAKREIMVVPWFEYGFKVPSDAPLAMARPQWITVNAQGTRASEKAPAGSNVVWLNPLLPEVQRFFVDLMVEFLGRYGVPRIQWDDNFSIPSDLLYDSATRSLFQQQKGYAPPASRNDPRWREWVQWRADRISEAVRTIMAGVKAARPGVHVSLSPNPHAWAVDNYLQDWKAWLSSGAVDSVVVQLYRNSAQAFESELSTASLASERARAAVGVLAGLRVERTPFSLVKAQVEAARRAGYKGVSFFFYESLFNFPVPGESAEGRSAELKALFAGVSKEPSGF